MSAQFVEVEMKYEYRDTWTLQIAALDNVARIRPTTLADDHVIVYWHDGKRQSEYWHLTWEQARTLLNAHSPVKAKEAGQ